MIGWRQTSTGWELTRLFSTQSIRWLSQLTTHVEGQLFIYFNNSFRSASGLNDQMHT